MANMAGTIVQHSLNSDFDMKEHLESLINPNYVREKLNSVKSVVYTIYRFGQLASTIS